MGADVYTTGAVNCVRGRAAPLLLDRDVLHYVLDELWWERLAEPMPGNVKDVDRWMAADSSANERCLWPDRHTGRTRRSH